MARIRYLKPDFFTNEELGELPPEHRIFFAGLWCYADREGRLKDKPKRLKAVILPFDSADPNKILHDLQLARFITRYKVDGEFFILINNFSKHQKVHHKEPKSVIPGPTKTKGCRVMDKPSMEQVGSTGPLLAPYWPPPDPLGNGQRVTGNGQRVTESKSSTEPKVSPIGYDAATFSFFNISELTKEIWRTAFPAVDIDLELNRMSAWLKANPEKRKRRYEPFINRWLSKTQDRGGSSVTGKPKANRPDDWKQQFIAMDEKGKNNA